MKNRFLFVGDPWWGEEPSAGDLFVNALLVEYPQVPLETYVLASNRYTLDHLFQHSARDLIGLQAGSTLLCCGWLDANSGLSSDEIVHQYAKLVHELLHNSATTLYVCTFPLLGSEPQSLRYQKLKAINDFLRTPNESDRYQLIDVDKEFEHYQGQQLLRNEGVRSLLTEKGCLNSLGTMLWVRILRENTGLFTAFFIIFIP